MMKKILEEKILKIKDPLLLERINEEVKLVKYHHLEEEIIAVYELINVLKQNDIPSYIMGNSSNCYIMYILGVSNVDPLRFNLKYQTFFGEEQNATKISNSKLNITVMIPKSAYDNVLNFLKHFELLKNKEIKITKYSFNIGKLSITSFELPHRIEGFYNEVNYSLLEKFVINEYSESEYDYESIKIKVLGNDYKTNSNIFDHMKIFGLTHGTWKYNDKIEEINKLNMPLLKIPVFFDDIYDLLIENKYDLKKAWEIANLIRLGKGVDEKRLNTSLDIAQWCNSVRYLFPRAHAIEFFIFSYRLNLKLT